jgi:NAD(P)H dehydrogenase (quinone)
MNKVLIVFYSPVKDSFTEKIALRLQTILERNKNEVVMRGLKSLHFNPVTSQEEIDLSKEGKYLDDVLIEQRYISEANHIFLVYPIYQLAMPAVMKGYVDRVFTQGFSYSFRDDGTVVPHMGGKQISFFSPMGATLKYATEMGNIQAMNHIIKNTFGFRGFEIKAIHYFDNDDRGEQLNNFEKLL